MNLHQTEFWNTPSSELISTLGTTSSGLTDFEAGKRLKEYGPNLLKARRSTASLILFLSQFKSPIILLLLFSAALSFFLGEPTDATIILVIVLASGFLGFWQERGASQAMEKLLSIVRIQAKVVRDGNPMDIPVEDIVPGDVVILSAGDVIPGDALILESNDFFVDEATLTGETFPAEKKEGVLPHDTHRR